MDLFSISPLPRTIAAALRDVSSKRPEVRRSALLDLVRHVDSPDRSTIVDVLGQVLEGDPDPLAREVVAIASADNEIVELVPRLLKTLEDPAPRVRQMVLLALGELAQASDADVIAGVRTLLASPLPALRYQALVAWRRLLGSAGLSELIAALDDRDLEVRWLAWTLIEELIEVSPPSSSDAWIESLRSRCDDDDVRIRAIGAAVMARLGETSALGRLLEFVENTRGLGRRDLANIARRFGQFKFEPARAWLARHARRNWFEGTLWWPAIVALAALGDESARSTILEELEAGSVRRRGRALEAVKDLGLAAALERVKELEQRSTGPEAWLVRETLDALGKDPV